MRITLLILTSDWLCSLGQHCQGKNGVTELNDILINSTPNSWIKQLYVQVFDYESITF